MDSLNSQVLLEFNEADILKGSGNLESKLILIGEAPGANEVEHKKPFVGQSGKYLQEFLDILRLDKDDLYITNAVKFRPTKESKKTGKNVNRTPTKSEIKYFKEFLYKEIDILKPKVIATLGNIPLKVIMKDDKANIGKYHGKVLSTSIYGNYYVVFPLYHPAAIIYRRELKEIYLNDLKQLNLLLKNILYD